MPCRVTWGSIRASQEAESVRGNVGKSFYGFREKEWARLWEGMSRLG